MSSARWSGTSLAAAVARALEIGRLSSHPGPRQLRLVDPFAGTLSAIVRQRKW